MPVRERLARLFGVLLRMRPAELPPVLVLGGWMFCLVGGIWLTRAVRDSLFLANVSARQLPYLYIASPLTVSAVGTVYARFADRVRRERLVAGTAALTATALVLCRLSLGSTGTWIYYALYSGADIACSLAAMQFWTVAGDQFTARDAKRLIGLIAAGGTVANIVIGFGVSGVAKKAGAENLLFICAGLFLATGGLALLLARMYGGRLGRSRRRAGGSKDTRGLAAPGAGHLRLVATIVVCGVLTFTMLDFLFKTITAAHFNGDRVAMVSFFGLLSGVTGILSLLIQLGVTSRLLAKVGVTGVLLFLPVLLSLGATGLLILPGLAAATFCKASEGTLRYTLQDAGMQLVYVPVPSQVRSRVKATIDTIVRPGTESLVGVLLLGARAIKLAVAPLAVVAMATSTVWIVSVIRLRKAYVKSLRETLRRKRVDLERLPDLRELGDAGGVAPPADTPPPAIMELLGGGRRAVRAIASSGPGSEVELARVLVDENGRFAQRRDAAGALGALHTAEAGAALVAALGVGDERVRGAVCQALARAHRSNPALPVARDALLAACDRELAAAFRALAAAEGLGRDETALNPDGTRAAPPFLRHEPEGAAALASKALRERTERARDRIFLLLEVLHPDQGLRELAVNLAEADPARRANAIEVLDATVDRRLRKTLVVLVDETPRYLKLNSVSGLLAVPRLTRDAWVEELLSDPSPWMVATAAWYAGMHQIVGLTERLEQLSAHPTPFVAEAARGALARFRSEEPVLMSQMTTVEKVLFLKGIDLFSALAGEDLADIASIAEEVEKDQGETVIVEGEHGDALYFVLEGKVAVQKAGKTIAELGERDVLGEMALLDPGPRSASAVALTDVSLLAIGREDFDDIMRERPEVPIGVMKVLVRRLRSAIAVP